MEKISNEIQRELADRVFFTIRNVGYEHPVNVEGFTSSGVEITFGGGYKPLYGEEISALIAEFGNVILDSGGLALYDN